MALDGFQPKVWKTMPAECWQETADLLNSAEHMIMFPLKCLLDIIALLGKTEVDDRPSALTHLLYALYIGIRRPILAEWETSNHGWWDDAVEGNFATESS